MTASEPPAKWGADSRGDDDVRRDVHSGGGQGRRSPQEENNTKTEDKHGNQTNPGMINTTVYISSSSSSKGVQE